MSRTNISCCTKLYVDFNNKFTTLQLIMIAMISNKIEICGDDYHKEGMQLLSPTDCNSSFTTKMEFGDKTKYILI